MLFDSRFFQEFKDSVDHDVAEFFMRHLATAIKDLNTYFMTFGEEFAHLTELDIQVALTNFEAEPHLLEFACLVASAILLRFFHLLILVFTPVDDFCNGRVSIGRDFNQVEASFFGSFERVCTTQNTELFTRLSDNAQLLCSNLLVDANRLTNSFSLYFLGLGRGRFELLLVDYFIKNQP